jgi:hypothetical protein
MGFGAMATMQQLVNLPCGRCDHQMVQGVACDGQYEDCFYLTEKRERSAQRRARAFLFDIKQIAYPGEFDAVRGED